MGVQIQGLQNVLQNIAMIAHIETAKMNNKIIMAGNLVENAVKNQASETDHSLTKLAEMGHPYSRNYGTNSGPHGDDTIVHSQNGLLLANIEKTENLNSIRSTVEVGVDEGKVPYIGDLITGTSKQRPRNFIGKAFRDKLDEVRTITQGR